MAVQEPNGWLLARAWRCSQLLQLGLSYHDAAQLADDDQVEIDQVEHLIQLGCPVKTAVRIVAS